MSVSCWCKKMDDLENLRNKIDEILINNNFEQMKSERYLDPDINLIMSSRIYETVAF